MDAICTPDVDARRRRLEELFADEPHLSATMRASRLHEREDLPTLKLIDGSHFRMKPEVATAPRHDRHSSDATVTRVGFVVNVSQEPQGLRAEVRAEEAPDVMTAPEAARFLRVCEGTLRRWVRELGLPAAQVGRSRRYRKPALLRWLRRREQRD